MIGAIAGALGSLGLGGGTVLMLWMAFFTETKAFAAVGVNLLGFLASGIFPAAVFLKRGLADAREVLRTVLAGLPGVLAGWLLSFIQDGQLLSKLFGVFLLFIGFSGLFSKKTKNKAKTNPPNAGNVLVIRRDI